MHHLLLIDLFEARHELLKDQPGLQLRESTSPKLLQVVEVSSVTEIHEQIEVVLCALNVMKTDYVRTRYFRQDVYLVLQVVEQPWSQA